MARHESLRTYFEIVNNEPVQRINVFAGVQGPAARGAYQIFSKKAPWPPEAAGSFDLSRAPLFRWRFIKQPDNGFLWWVEMHHIISDGLSMGVLAEDFSTLYAGGELPPLKLQYKDFAAWQNRLAADGAIKKQEAYWLNLYRDAQEIPRLQLFTDHERPPVFTFSGAHYAFRIESRDAQQFQALASRGGGTLYMNILAALNTLFYKYTGQTDIIIGSGIAGRSHIDLQKIIGMFVNMLAMRNYPHGEKTYASFFHEVIANSAAAFENQDVQFEELVNKLDLERDPSRTPLFDISMVVQDMNSISNNPAMPTSAENLSFQNTTAKFDMTFFISPQADDIDIDIEYYTGIFAEATIQRLAGHFKNVIHAIVTDPSLALKDIEIISPEEKERILSEFNNTAGAYPQHKTIHGLFEDQAQRTPDHIAIFSHGRTRTNTDNKMFITYRKLNMTTDHLAWFLVAQKGIKLEDRMIIYMSQPVPRAVAILATLKSGAAYVPIAPSLPVERVRSMIKDAAAALVLSETQYHHDLNTLPLDCEGLRGQVYLDELVETAAPQPINVSPNSLAYIIYTSGTTGQPKGVQVEHGGVVNMLSYRAKEYAMKPGDAGLQLFSYVFDGFVTGFFTPLISGARLVLLEDEQLGDAEKIRDAIIIHGITHFICVPSLYAAILELPDMQKAVSLKAVTLAGERISAGLLDKPTPFEIVNEYGVTECSVLSTLHRRQERDKHISIGQPIANTGIFILDSNLQLLPIGVYGELCVSGHGLARGYLNQPELTEERFKRINRSYGSYRTYIFYKTGDLSRWLNDGSIEFLGRIDHQVKIRGFRIELGEIEAQLLHHNDIKEAVVLAQDDHLGNKYLCAYFVGVKECSISQLREHLAKVLPDYMIPSYFVKIDKIPLTSNGKIDRKALPNPELNSGESYTAPQNDIEKKLVEVWAEILGRDSVQVSQLQTSIGIDDHFFQVGGHSLKATALATRIKKEWNVYMPLVEIFKNSTIRGQANYISGTKLESTISDDEQLVQLKVGSPDAGNLFLIHDGTGEVEGYLEFCKDLKEQWNCWGLRFERLENLAPRQVTIPELAKNYVTALKKIQPQGPYLLAGWSLGGIIAYEMALQLEQAGETLTMLTLFDSPLPAKNAPLASDETRQFNLQTECEFIKDYVGNDFLEKLNCAAGITFTQFWPFVIDYLQDNHFDVEDIKKIIREYGMAALPNYEHLGLEEAVYYLNVGRTLSHARVLYTPAGKINAPIHYIEAEKTGQAKKVNKETWNEFTTSTVTYETAPGDHYSIFRNPQVKEMTRIFNNLV
jgi:amino acid adenylation domain-containing protein